MTELSDGTWTVEPAPLDDDLEIVSEAAAKVELALSPAIHAGVAIMHHLDPDTYARLMAAIDNGTA